MKTPPYYLLLLLLLGTLCGSLSAHDAHYEKTTPKIWKMVDGSSIEGYFFLQRDGEVYIEKLNEQIVHFPVSKLSENDRHWLEHKHHEIAHLNGQNPVKIAQPVAVSRTAGSAGPDWFIPVAIAALLLLVAWLLLKKSGTHIFRFVFAFLMVSFSMLLYNFGKKQVFRAAGVTNPGFLDSAFAPFKPAVNTRWDNTWFYVESKGLPDHSMMTGITSWQQQVPIFHCYIGSNAWSIPLNPVKAATPVPVNNKHFLRGAVAIAANGIPIFNPYTNTGVDAYLDGQLDNWGGHSGRADDYHYHIAPMFLEAKSGPVTPIGFALDGYAIYGGKEPDGTAMKALDANHGHTGSDGRYHYHGTAAAPYMIGNMVGVVNEDTTLQIVPQAVAKGVRPALTPLKGATITGFHPNGSNGYTLIYTLAGATDSIVYSWDASGKFVYDFYTPAGKNTQNYNGKAVCQMPSSTDKLSKPSLFQAFPNPASDVIRLSMTTASFQRAVSSVALYNSGGACVFRKAGFVSAIQVQHLPKGIYFVELQKGETRSVTKVVLK